MFAINRPSKVIDERNIISNIINFLVIDTVLIVFVLPTLIRKFSSFKLTIKKNILAIYNVIVT